MTRYKEYKGDSTERVANAPQTFPSIMVVLVLHDNQYTPTTVFRLSSFSLGFVHLLLVVGC